MAVNPPPIQEKSSTESGIFTRIWIRWFESVYRDSQEGFTGSFTNGDGDTVTVVNGRITDVS